ncbi:MAG TPA: hypothetical protein VMF50_02815 [Candidatus Binataceae bacterium]|nr:hypothetical protein [Candidatus Binataceae bacterium]
MGNLDIPEEDGAGLKLGTKSQMDRQVSIGVLVFPRISNYTDFEPFLHEPDVSLQYVEHPDPAATFDVICFPGTKSTIADLAWLRAKGWDKFIAAHYAAGGFVVGICGGYQMMGRRIEDPEYIESDVRSVDGLGLLDLKTVFEKEKITSRVDGIHVASGLAISGYEIHCGRITSLSSNRPFRIRKQGGISPEEFEGAFYAGELVHHPCLGHTEVPLGLGALHSARIIMWVASAIALVLMLTVRATMFTR